MPPETGKKSLSPARSPRPGRLPRKGRVSPVRRLKRASSMVRGMVQEKEGEVKIVGQPRIPPRPHRKGREQKSKVTVLRRTEHPRPLSVCPNRRHLPLPAHRQGEGDKATVPSPFRHRRKKPSRLTAAMEALRSPHYENIDILQHPSATPTESDRVRHGEQTSEPAAYYRPTESALSPAWSAWPPGLRLPSALSLICGRLRHIPSCWMRVDVSFFYGCTDSDGVDVWDVADYQVVAFLARRLSVFWHGGMCYTAAELIS